MPGDNGSESSLVFSIGTDIQSRTSPPRTRAVFALSNDVSHTFISHSEVTQLRVIVCLSEFRSVPCEDLTATLRNCCIFDLLVEKLGKNQVYILWP